MQGFKNSKRYTGIYICAGESERDPPAGVWCIYEGMWEIMCCGGEGEREGGRGGERGEREHPFVKTTRQAQHTHYKQEVLTVTEVPSEKIIGLGWIH
jgi:hypothetical protein